MGTDCTLDLVPAFRGLHVLNRTYSARDSMITTSLILFTLTRRANLRGTAFRSKINQLHLATIATLANFSVDKLTRYSTGTVDSAEKIVIDLHVRTVSRDLDLDLPVVYTVSSHLYRSRSKHKGFRLQPWMCLPVLKCILE